MVLNKFPVVLAVAPSTQDVIVLDPEYVEDDRIVSENYTVILSGVGRFHVWYDRDAYHLSYSLYASDNEPDQGGLLDEQVKPNMSRIDWAIELIKKHAASR